MKNLARRIYYKLESFRPTQINEPPTQINEPPLESSPYIKHVESLKKTYEIERAMKLAVGGEFDAVGVLELETLKHFDLKENAYLVDVGCGSGRLSKPLSPYLKGRYLGIDIVPDLVDFASRIVGRADWRFEVAEGLSIPEEDGAADMICFFSVFTHLLHEQTYVYLQEAKRVLKPEGKIVFSFLDFTIPSHWDVFQVNLKNVAVNSHPLNMFISKDAIKVWAERLDLQVQAMHDGDKPYVPLPEPVVWEDGRAMEDLGTIGQSVCVLRKLH